MRETVVTADGRQLTEPQIRRSLRINILAASLGMGWWAVIMGMPLTMLFEALGASGVMMGAVTTLIQISMVMQLPGALIVDRLKSRKPAWFVGNIIARGLWILLPVLLYFYADRPMRVAQCMLLFVGLSSVLNALLGSAWWSWITDLVPETLRAKFWGTRQSFTVAAYLVSTWAAGYILDLFRGTGTHAPWLGFQVLFLLATILGVADIIVHLRVPEPRAARPQEGLSLGRRLCLPLTYPDFRRLTLAMGFYTFSMGLVSLGLVYLKRDFGVSYSHLSAITIFANLGSMGVGLAGGYVLQRIGGRAFGSVMLLLAPVLSLCWFWVHAYRISLPEIVEGVPGELLHSLLSLLPAAWEQAVANFHLPQVIWVLLLFNFFAGVVHGGISLCQVNMCGGLAPKEGRAVAMAEHWCMVGLIGATGSLISGQVMDYFIAHPLNITLPSGTPLSFFHVLIVAHMAIIWFIALPLQLSIRRKSGEPDFAGAVSRLVVPNPVRAVTNIVMLNTARTSRRRAAAVRTIGEKRTVLAVSDLIEKLDDPSADVRDEAVFALGRIGSDEAIDALLQKLNDPNADLAPQIARALRQAPTARSVDALLRKLGDPDRETRSESARTLGAIGDRRAAPSLLDLLAHSEDAKVVAATGEALARIGELAAIYELVPRMKETRNPVLKRSLAVAIGDLLGEREAFYKVLVQEQQSRGSQVANLMRELRRSIVEAAAAAGKDAAPLLPSMLVVQDAYENEKLDRCVVGLFDLGVNLAKLNWGITFEGDAAAFLPDLAWRNEQFGVGMWYLTMLRHGWDPAKLGPLEDVDVLLGVFFVYSRGIPSDASGERPSAAHHGVRLPWR